MSRFFGHKSLFCLLLPLSACGKTTSNTDTQVDCTAVTYAQIKQTMLDKSGSDRSKCRVCHSSEASTGGQLRPFDTYDQVSASAQEILSKISSTRADVMPPSGKLPDSTILLFKQWVNNCNKQQ